ncbi:MAG: hypothetical protein Q9187_007809 [Circinaria calcarea]
MPSLALHPLPRIAPTPPNFHVCHEFYGQALTFNDCTLAGENLPRSADPIYYYAGDLPPPSTLIWHYTVGECTVSIERVGPNIQGHIRLVPDYMRGMVGWVISQCVTPSALGGFVTVSFENMVNYITNPSTRFEEPFSPASSFFTVTVSRPRTGIEIKPGERDPTIPATLSDALLDVAENMRVGSPFATRYWDGAVLFATEALALDREGESSWWQNLRSERFRRNEMVYECDAKLGTPVSAHCNQLEYSQLGPLSDTIIVGPGLDKLLSLKTCHVAITASIKLVLTWDQIKVALDRLINQCVLHPLKPTVGGRAYYGVQSLHRLHGRGGQRRKTLNGLNALPRHANITLY